MTTVASGQTLSVTSGQTSTGVIVDSGGTLNVFAGGKVSSTVDSGFVNVSGGKAVSTIVVSGGVEEVVAGIDSLTTISSGGFAFVSSGGTAIGTKIEGFQRVEGKATGAKVSSGGDQTFQFTGTAIGTTVYSASQQEVFSGARAVGTTLSGGAQSRPRRRHRDCDADSQRCHSADFLRRHRYRYHGQQRQRVCTAIRIGDQHDRPFGRVPTSNLRRHGAADNGGRRRADTRRHRPRERHHCCVFRAPVCGLHRRRAGHDRKEPRPRSRHSVAGR